MKKLQDAGEHVSLRRRPEPQTIQTEHKMQTPGKTLLHRFPFFFIPFCSKVLTNEADETKNNPFHNETKRKKCEGEKTASSIKHGRASFMAGACVFARGTGALAFIDDFTPVGSNMMHTEV